MSLALSNPLTTCDRRMLFPDPFCPTSTTGLGVSPSKGSSMSRLSMGPKPLICIRFVYMMSLTEYSVLADLSEPDRCVAD